MPLGLAEAEEVTDAARELEGRDDAVAEADRADQSADPTRRRGRQSAGMNCASMPRVIFLSSPPLSPAGAGAGAAAPPAGGAGGAAPCANALPVNSRLVRTTFRKVPRSCALGGFLHGERCHGQGPDPKTLQMQIMSCAVRKLPAQCTQCVRSISRGEQLDRREECACRNHGVHIALGGPPLKSPRQ